MILHDFIFAQQNKFRAPGDTRIIGDHLRNRTWVNHDIQHQFVYIPKNASSWAKQKLQKIGFAEHDVRAIVPDYKKIIILRDPLDRYISALSHWSHKLLDDQLDLIEQHPQFLDIILKSIVVPDFHTELQAWFLQDICDDNVIFFWYNNNLEENFDLYFLSVGIELTKIQPINTARNTRLCKNFITQRIEHNKHILERLKDFYRQDYEICRSIEFYNMTCPTCIYYN